MSMLFLTAPGAAVLAGKFGWRLNAWVGVNYKKRWKEAMELVRRQEREYDALRDSGYGVEIREVEKIVEVPREVVKIVEVAPHEWILRTRPSDTWDNSTILYASRGDEEIELGEIFSPDGGATAAHVATVYADAQIAVDMMNGSASELKRLRESNARIAAKLSEFEKTKWARVKH